MDPDLIREIVDAMIQRLGVSPKLLGLNPTINIINEG
jgi:hypothetical protein